MPITVIDVSMMMGAVAVLGVLLVPAGVAIAALLPFPSGRRGAPDLGAALLVAFAVLPVALGLAMRAGAWAGALLVLACAGLGLRRMASAGWPPVRGAQILAGALWCAVATVVWVDFGHAGKLYPSNVVIDGVKHAATVEAVLRAGVPPDDAFFLRPEPAGYYHYFYLLPAIAKLLAGGLIDARAAVYGLAFWTGCALLAAVVRVHALVFPPGKGHAALGTGVVALLVAATGLDLLPALAFGTAVSSLDAWNTEVTSWVNSLLWVPHHVAGLLAMVAAFCAVLGTEGERAPRSGVALAAAGFASMFGLSVWVALAGALASLLWLVALALARRRRLAWHLVLAGAGALALSLPQMLDVLAYRHHDGFPVAATIRPFMGMTPGSWVNVPFLPINYGIEFGVFAVGTVMFWAGGLWRQSDRAGLHLLAALAVAGLLLGTFLRSVIVNNDLGWRVMLLPQFATLVWTALIVQTIRLGAVPRRGVSLLILSLALGWAGTAYGVWQSRTVVPRVLARAGLTPAIAHQAREAYRWSARNLPGDAVLQHNPLVRIALPFGLYGGFRPAVSDRYNGVLFGASAAMVQDRVAALGPVFLGTAEMAGVLDVTRRLGITHLVASSADPAWQDRTGWVWRLPAAWAGSELRVLDVN